MKKNFIIISLSVLTGIVNAQTVTFKTLEDKISYIFGYYNGKQFSSMNVSLNPANVVEGMKAGMDSNIQPLMTQEEMDAAAAQFDSIIRSKMESQNPQQEIPQASAEEIKANEDAGKKYTDDEKKKNKKYITTTSGLSYLEIKKGKGEKPTPTSKVKVHYKGYLVDGSVFDSSYDRNQPVEFPVNGVIKGWQEALVLMTPGSSFKLIIPANLAYGNNPPPGSGIKAGSTLVFDVELLEIIK
jgi:FKBP-type peptidyl-prolyl cis-trans isomerase